jgi:hypothetical protein
MRIPKSLTLLAILGLAACASGPDEPRDGGGSPAKGSGTSHPNVTKVEGKPILAEWRNLDPGKGTVRIGLLNKSSPDMNLLYRDKYYQGYKPIEDDAMGNVLLAYEELDFYDLATKGKSARDYRMGDGHGVVSITIGDEKWALVFRPNTPDAQHSPIPKTYRDLKVLLMQIYNQTLYFSPTAPQDPNRVFKIDPPKYPRR